MKQTFVLEQIYKENSSTTADDRQLLCQQQSDQLLFIRYHVHCMGILAAREAIYLFVGLFGGVLKLLLNI